MTALDAYEVARGERLWRDVRRCLVGGARGDLARALRWDGWQDARVRPATRRELRERVEKAKGKTRKRQTLIVYSAPDVDIEKSRARNRRPRLAWRAKSNRDAQSLETVAVRTEFWLKKR